MPDTPSNFQALLASAHQGDAAAREQLFRSTYPVVGPIVHRSLERDMRRGRPWLDARFSTGDIVQEVCRSVLEDLSSFAGTTRADFEGYLALLTRNRIIDAIRHHEAERRDGRRGRPDPEHGTPCQREAQPDVAAEQLEFQERFAAALADLPERERILVRARLDGEHSFEELTRMLGYSSTSKTQRVFAEVRARIATRISRELAEGM